MCDGDNVVGKLESWEELQAPGFCMMRDARCVLRAAVSCATGTRNCRGVDLGCWRSGGWGRRELWDDVVSARPRLDAGGLFEVVCEVDREREM